jgi:serine/threonine protein kinase
VRQADPYVGREILTGQFKVLERIGSGGMGAVYKAQQPSMDRFVAVKILHSKFTKRKDLVSRFRREARAMSHLTHPNTAKVFLYGQLEDEACYIVMEYLEGRNLGQIVRQEGPMKPERAIAVLIQACGALEEAHQKGIIHRDLKPENIFLCSQGGLEDFAKVLDFGLAKVTEREMQPGSLILTQEGMVFGTPEFMSPEQAQGKTLDPRSDVYSLAVILYELLTGKLPFDARTPMEFIGLHVQATPIPLAERAPGNEYPFGLQEVLDRALAKKPEERYQSAAEFASALRSLVNDRNVEQAMSAIPDAAAALAETVPSIAAMQQRSQTPRSLRAVDGGAMKVPTPQPAPATPATPAAQDASPIASVRPKQVTNPQALEARQTAPAVGGRTNTAGLIAIGVVIGLIVAVGALVVIRLVL